MKSNIDKFNMAHLSLKLSKVVPLHMSGEDRPDRLNMAVPMLVTPVGSGIMKLVVVGNAMTFSTVIPCSRRRSSQSLFRTSTECPH